MHLSSSAFQDGGEIPRTYTREGADRSPPIAWSDVPEGTASLALIVEDPDAPDPDAPERTFVHWVAYNIPWEAGGLPEGAGQTPLPGAGRHGRNDWGAEGYGGPKPPRGRHRYFFRLFALDTEMSRGRPLTKEALEKAMEGHVLATATWMGTYEARARKAA